MPWSGGFPDAQTTSGPPSPPESGWDRTRSWRPWARAGWGRSTAPATSGSDREVAVKVLPPESFADPDRLRRFEQEAKAAGALNHPNLVAVFDTGQHEGNPYVVFELLDGVTLRQRLGAQARFPAQGRGLRGPDRARPGRGPREGDRAPGPEAREPVRDQGRAGQDPGLRPGQAPAGARPGRPSRRRGDGFHRDRGGRRPRHRRLHVARAGPGRSRRPSVRHLLLRRGALRDALGPAAVLGRDQRRGDDGDPQGRPAGAGGSRRSSRIGARGEALPREATRGALPVGAGHRLRPGGRLGGFVAGISRPAPLPVEKRRRNVLAAGAAVVVAGVLELGYYRVAPAPGHAAPPSFKQLTFRRGVVHTARFAPDGHTIVYGAAWEGNPSQVFSARLRRPGIESARRARGQRRVHLVLRGSWRC